MATIVASARATPGEIPVEHWYAPRRPWYALYGLRLKAHRHNQDGEDEDEEEDMSPLMLLPNEILYDIMRRCGPYALGASACVDPILCRKVGGPHHATLYAMGKVLGSGKELVIFILGCFNF